MTSAFVLARFKNLIDPELAVADPHKPPFKTVHEGTKEPSIQDIEPTIFREIPTTTFQFHGTTNNPHPGAACGAGALV